ncbi:unnamed protein product [Euphydryas editha]|uniref:Uncharacterized protein n=1 Tax=Euphydryas editha TaxID=104508 RepID=A0AAU9TUU6_EUPED|nr:unnamed protein product [Euphydryas editha]
MNKSENIGIDRADFITRLRQKGYVFREYTYTPGLYHMPPELQMLHTSASMQHLQVHHPHALHALPHGHAHAHGHAAAHGHVAAHAHGLAAGMPHAATLGQLPAPLCHRHNTLYRAP